MQGFRKRDDESSRSLQDLLGTSPEMERVRRFVSHAAPVDAPVLIMGETGTGKSLVARVIHRESPRALQPLVSVNCAGVPDGLFESEFFGHQKGAFTGALDSRKGLFELAHLGTLFMDEIGELPLGQQVKLLTVLEEREIRKVGGTFPIPVDVRVVAATSRDLPSAMVSGGFRQDLFHRIGVLRCILPPLRDRPGDIIPLANHLLRTLGARHGYPAPSIQPEGWSFLLRHAWPGNIRELAHVLEAALIFSSGRPVERAHLAEVVDSSRTRGAPPATVSTVSTVQSTGSGETAADAPVVDGRYSFFGSDEEERESLSRTLERCRGNRSRAARELGMARNTLRSKMEKFGLA